MDPGLTVDGRRAVGLGPRSGNRVSANVADIVMPLGQAKATRLLRGSGSCATYAYACIATMSRMVSPRIEQGSVRAKYMRALIADAATVLRE